MLTSPSFRVAFVALWTHFDSIGDVLLGLWNVCGFGPNAHTVDSGILSRRTHDSMKVWFSTCGRHVISNLRASVGAAAVATRFSAVQWSPIIGGSET